jgi:hypothetical protein
MKKMYSVLASLSMLLSMPAVASSFSERLMKEGCEDFDAEAIQQDDALATKCLVDTISVETDAPMGPAPICERGGA